MGRGWVLGLLALASGVVSVALAVAVNVATGGVLPPALRPLAGWAWPAVGAGAVAAAGLALWQQRLQLPVPAPTTAPADPPPPLTPAQLPSEVADFTGRETDEASPRAAFAGGARVVAVAGPPGVGKSTLANRLAHVLRERCPDGRLYVNLGAGRGDPMPPDEALARFLAALGDTEPAPYGDAEALAARYRSMVPDRRLLVVLDDAHDAAQVRPLLPAGPRCLAIVTSRPLQADLPEAVTYELAPLGTADALALLARVSNPEGDGADAEAGAAAEEAVAVHRRAGNRLGEAYGLAGVGRVACEEGDTATALARHRDALRLFEELGDAPGTADAHGDLGGLFVLLGDHAAAVREFEAALAVLSGLRHPVAAGLCRLRLAEALALAGDLAGAAREQRSGEALLTGTDGWRQLDEARERLAALGLRAGTTG
ncbi:tetratricopeptide repeat protein [Streptomyces sp. NPDC008238]